MAASVVQHAGYDAGNNPQTLSKSVTAGNLLVVGQRVAGTHAGATPPSDGVNTWVKMIGVNQTTDGHCGIVWVCTAATTATLSIVCAQNAGAGSNRGVFAEVHAASPFVSPLDVVVGAQGNNPTGCDSGFTAALAQADEAAIGFTTGDSGYTWGVPAPWAKLEDASASGRCALYYQETAATTAINLATGAPVPLNWTSMVAMFKVPVVGGPTQTVPVGGVYPSGFVATIIGTFLIGDGHVVGGAPSGSNFGHINAVAVKVVGSVSSAQTFGAVTIRLATSRAVTGVASAAAFGALSLSVGGGGGLVFSPAGVPSAQSFGTLRLPLSPGGVTSAQRFGIITIHTGPVQIGVLGVPSAQQFGTQVFAYRVYVRPSAPTEVILTPTAPGSGGSLLTSSPAESGLLTPSAAE